MAGLWSGEEVKDKGKLKAYLQAVQIFMANCEQNMYRNEHSHYIKLKNKLSSTIKTPLLAFYQGLISLLATTKTTS